MHLLHELGIAFSSSSPPQHLRPRRLRRLLRAALDLQRRRQRQRHHHRRPKLPLQRPAGRPQQGDLRPRAGVGGDARRPRRRAGREAQGVRLAHDADRPGETTDCCGRWRAQRERESCKEREIGKGGERGKSENFDDDGENQSSRRERGTNDFFLNLLLSTTPSKKKKKQQTSTYTFKDTAQLIAYQEGRYGSYEYGRYGNPTTRTAEEKIRVLEAAEDCLVSSSGMNAATTMLLALVPAGGHIVTTTDCYRRTRQFIQTVLPKMGIGATVIDPSDLGALERALDEHDVSLFFSESPTNPYLRCVDIGAIKALCEPKGCLVAIDSTFATPVNQRACCLGADLVLHSGTKYLAGHNDVLVGAIAGRAEPVAAVRAMHNVLGGTVDPHAAWLLLRGLKTLVRSCVFFFFFFLIFFSLFFSFFFFSFSSRKKSHLFSLFFFSLSLSLRNKNKPKTTKQGLRVNQQNATALELARRLEAHPRVSRVHYPGLPSHPDHEIAVRQMSGFGGVVSFEVDADLWGTAAVIDGVRIPYIAPSLGGVESLIEQPTVISYWDQGPDERARIGIKDSLIRYACGVEDVEDLWADLKRALEAAPKVGKPAATV